MRLIDLDEFLRENCISRIEGESCEGCKFKTLEVSCERLLAQPTIDPVKWVPVSERLPEEPFGCLVTVWNTNPVTMDEFENILPYFVGWDGEQWNDGDGEQCPFEVIAWMPLPEPWEGEEP